MSLFDDKVQELMNSISEKAKAEPGADTSRIEIAKTAGRESNRAEVPPTALHPEENCRGSAEGLPSLQIAESDYLLAKKQAEDDVAQLLAKFRVKEEPELREASSKPVEAVPEAINTPVQQEPAQTVQSPPVQKLKKQKQRNWKDVIVVSLLVAAMLIIPFVIYRLMA